MTLIRVTCLAIFFVIVHYGFCDRDWWKRTNIYEVYVPSFKDSDGDGVGDLRGIASKLQHFVDLGIETIWLSPIYKSPMIDMGYDVQDYTAINPLYGTMIDFDDLMKEIKLAGLKIILDFVPNHSSSQHEWFQKSVERIAPFTDYFVWKNSSGYDENMKPIPPNNWASIFGGSAWTFNDKRGQFYLHKFLPLQPDFDLRNPTVKKELLDVFKFWLNKGVDGFRLDAVNQMIEDAEFRNETYIDPKYEGDLNFNHMTHKYISNQFGSCEVIHEWRSNIEQEYNQNIQNDSIIFIAEIYSTINYSMLYYGRSDYLVVNFPINYRLMTHEKYPTANFFSQAITTWINNLPYKDAVPNWAVENHDQPRLVNRQSEESVDMMNILICLLPGVPVLYYGQEIGMKNTDVRPDQRVDSTFINLFPGFSRDFCRSPMQWDDSMNAGFTTKVKPWLPVNPNYWYLNVNKEKHSSASHYSIVKKLLQLKKSETARFGDLKTYVMNDWVFTFTRCLQDHETHVVIFNFGSEMEIIKLNTTIANLTEYVKVVISSINAGYYSGDVLSATDRFSMRPKSALVLTTFTENEGVLRVVTEPREISSEPKDTSSPSSAPNLKLNSFLCLVLYFISKNCLSF